MSNRTAKSSTEPLWWTLANAGWFSLLVGTIIGLIGLYAAWIFYTRARPNPSLQLTSDSTIVVGPVQGPLAEKLEIRFGGAPVPQVTSTTIALWNDGTATFRREDIAQHDPIRLVLQAGAFLQADIESVSRNVIGARVTIDAEDRAVLAFDFFEPNDALIVRVLHSSAPGALSNAGTIIGLQQGIRPYQPFKRRKTLSRAVDKAFFVLLAAFVIGFVVKIGVSAGWIKALLIPGLLTGLAASTAGAIWLGEQITGRWRRAVPPVVLNNSHLRRRLEMIALFSRGN